jgi:hypothetical protein
VSTSITVIKLCFLVVSLVNWPFSKYAFAKKQDKIGYTNINMLVNVISIRKHSCLHSLEFQCVLSYLKRDLNLSKKKLSFRLMS